MKKIFVIFCFFLILVALKLFLIDKSKGFVFADYSPSGNYLVLNGGYLSTSNSQRSNPEGFTFEAWIKPSALSGYYPIISIGDSVKGSMHYEVGINGGLLSFKYIFGPWSSRLITSGQISDSVWQHIAVSVNSSTTKLYVNGLNVASTSGGSPLPAIGGNISLGNLHLQSINKSSFFHGVIDEVRISNSVREIGKLWISGIYDYPLQIDDNTILLWHMDSYKGEKIALDSSNNSINGQLVGWDNEIYFDGNLPLPTSTPFISPTPRWNSLKWNRPVLPTLSLGTIPTIAPQISSVPTVEITPNPTVSSRFVIPTSFYRR
jgi:hypothetical protein